MSRDSGPDLRGSLTFNSDKGAGRSKWLAILLALLLVGWMGSGFVIQPEDEQADVADTEIKPVAVEVLNSRADDVQLVLTAEGQSIPDRSTEIPAKASGQVLSVSVERGELVEMGQEIGRIDSETIEAQLVQAEAQLEQASTDLDRVIALLDQGITTERQAIQARASKAAAEALVTQIQEQLDNTIIRVPFSGRLNEMTLGEGEFVSDGDTVAEVLDNDPLSVVVQVPQQALGRLKQGQFAEVAFITGEKRMGTVNFIGRNADSQTRTFRVEVTVANPQSEMPAGLSARIAIPTGKARGHFISPAILSLGVNGELGVKTVNADNEVVFNLVSIVRAQTDGIWVTGLGEDARIITVGQGFVSAGDVVEPIERQAAQIADASK
ncbi:efflux RND transporter periplasmic adaptor subunit [Cognatishimia sp.]|uniref:efflux RND transporter periplasmic adaptor subunit n=1 Tax=Cognatishimia sp. TaxID=2211648 RepID=UPI00351527BA